MNRRTFLTTSAAAAAGLADWSLGRADQGSRWRVAVIGHTGRGNYGHGLDTAWLRLAHTEIVGVADADEGGLESAMKRLSVGAGFRDYRKMLDAVNPDVVAVCPRFPDQHRDMVIAAASAGAKAIYMEKPFCRTPAEADEIASVCQANSTQVAVAHRNRYHPALPAIDRLIAEGGIGQPLEIRGRGKGDRRGGAEDLWVLGSHVLNLMHYFGGEPKTCSAVLRQDGRPVSAADVRQGNEALGLIAGNQVHARYEMQRGLVGYFDSLAQDGTQGEGFGLQIIGSEGVIDIKCDRFPVAHLIPGNPFKNPTEPKSWLPITSAGVNQPEPFTDLAASLNSHALPIQDLLDCVGTQQRPQCGMEAGTRTVEMICATFASHRLGGQAVAFPLTSRVNELGSLSD